MLPVVRMVDTIHADVKNIPAVIPDDAGYISGTSDVDWTAGDFAKFSGHTIVRIWQGFGPVPADDAYDAIDVEARAVTPQMAADAVERRVNRGIQWTWIYGTDSTLAETNALIRAKGDHIWIGHVYSWLADWNLNEAEATALIGSMIHGATCISVQWASPSSNPNTVLPGTDMTLAQSNCDLSVTDARWGAKPAPPPPPVPVPPAMMSGFLCFIGSDGKLVSQPVTSSDSGSTWH